MLLGETVNSGHIKSSFSNDKGNSLKSHTFSYNDPSKIGTLEYKKFTPISKDAKYIIVKVVDKATDNLDLLSEFKLDLTTTPQNK